MDWLKEEITGIKTQLTNQEKRLDDIVIIQTNQQKDISHHIKRTDELQLIVTPLHNKYQQLIGVGKFIALAISTLGVVEIILKLLSNLHR